MLYSSLLSNSYDSIENFEQPGPAPGETGRGRPYSTALPQPKRQISVCMQNDSWPLRRSDALFVVAVVLFALPDPGADGGLGIPVGVKLLLVVAAVTAWIRFRVFGRSDRSTR
jgi:hypothetical protein